MYGIQLVLFLVFLGGLIAYLGDKVGMRVGRRRLTLFGMRPRHSSVVVTVVTGTLIAAFSLTVLAIASKDVQTALFRMKEIQTELAQTSEALAASEEELAAVKEELAGHRAAVQGIIDERDVAVAERDAARSEKERLEREVEAARSSLDQAQSALEQWKARVASLQELAETLEDSIAKMEATEAKLREDVSFLLDQYIAVEERLRDGEFVFLKDEIVAAAVVEGGGAREELEEMLLDLLEAADASGLRQGARIEGKERSIELADEAHFFEAVDLLASRAGRWVARVVALQNTVRGEPLLVYFHLFPETLLYREGEVIEERTLQGGGRGHEVELLGLLSDVNRDAIAKGMITSEEGDVGHLAGGEFIEALLAVKRSSGPVKVQAVAAKDVWNTEGPLKIRLVVTPVNR